MEVEDSTGTKVFDSGALTTEGSIAGNDNDADATAFEPHHELITYSGQVQIYETIMNNPARPRRSKSQHFSRLEIRQANQSNPNNESPSRTRTRANTSSATPRNRVVYR